MEFLSIRLIAPLFAILKDFSSPVTGDNRRPTLATANLDSYIPAGPQLSGHIALGLRQLLGQDTLPPLVLRK